jgi:hypothetical protein
MVSVYRYSIGKPKKYTVSELPVAILPTQTRFSIDAINDRIVQQRAQPIILAQEHSCIVVKGWAVDNHAKDVAGGVYIDVDGKLYPANYGMDRKDVAELFNDPSFRYSGYEGVIANLNQGHHLLSLRVLAKDMRAYYKPAQAVAFEIRPAVK